MTHNNDMQVRTHRSIQEALDEVARELNVRSRCFPRWITEGRVSRTDAQDRLDRLATAHVLLESLSLADMQAAVADVFHAAQVKTASQGK